MPAFRHAHDGDGPHAGKVEVAGIILHQTTQAILLLDDDGHREWLPKRQLKIELLKSSPQGEMVTVYMPEWLAKEKGLI